MPRIFRKLTTLFRRRRGWHAGMSVAAAVVEQLPWLRRAVQPEAAPQEDGKPLGWFAGVTAVDQLPWLHRLPPIDLAPAEEAKRVGWFPGETTPAAPVADHLPWRRKRQAEQEEPTDEALRKTRPWLGVQTPAPPDRLPWWVRPRGPFYEEPEWPGVQKRWKEAFSPQQTTPPTTLPADKGWTEYDVGGWSEQDVGGWTESELGGWDSHEPETLADLMAQEEPKHTGESYAFFFEFKNRAVVRAGDALAAAVTCEQFLGNTTTVSTDLTIAAGLIVGSRAYFNISGGVDGTTYKLRAKVTTASGKTLQAIGRLKVTDDY